MRNRILPALFVLISLSSFGQYKSDNVLFKTIDPSELCAMLKKNPGYLLLDVRSPGEHNDTSKFTRLNIGHLNGATNIDVGELPARWREIEAYKQKPVFVYCSHSQRSRRASKMLADSGFTQVFNVNGGLTSFYYEGLSKQDCLALLIASANGYSIISPEGLCAKMIGGKNVLVLDVRPDSVYNHTTTDAQLNAIGTIKNSTHIPLDKLQEQLSSVSATKDIIITDVFGEDAAKAGVLLASNGYKKVSVLIEGMRRFIQMPVAEVLCRSAMYLPSSPVKTMSPVDFGRLVQSNKDRIVIDGRSAEEIAGKHKDSYRNIGRIQNAVNITLNNIDEKLAAYPKATSTPIILYDFSGSKDIYQLAEAIAKKGFTNVSVLAGGIFNIRWTAANIKGQAYLKEMVVDVPEENL